MILKKLNKIIFKKFTWFLDILYPYRCPACKKIVNSSGFCELCWKSLIFIEEPCCFVCGKPIDTTVSKGLICAECLKVRYYFDRSFSVFVYNDTIAKSIFEFKFYQKLFLGKFFTNFLYNKIKNFDEKIDFIIGVPMHYKKLIQRGYNQSVILAVELSKKLNIPHINNLIIKIKDTKAQVKLNSKTRKVNLRHAFKLNNKYKSLIKNKNILIVDDVFTTGSTINECSKILKNDACVNRVFAITIAKTDQTRKYHQLQNYYHKNI